MKNQSRVVTYWEGTVVSRITPLNPIIRSLLNKVKQVWQLIRKSIDTNKNDQILKLIMHKNNQSESEIVHWQ